MQPNNVTVVGWYGEVLSKILAGGVKAKLTQRSWWGWLKICNILQGEKRHTINENKWMY